MRKIFEMVYNIISYDDGDVVRMTALLIAMSMPWTTDINFRSLTSTFLTDLLA